MKRRRKIMAAVLAAATAGLLTACGSSQTNAPNTTAAITAGTTEGITVSETENNVETGENGDLLGEGILIAYFSVMETDGTDTVGGASRVVVDGETLGNNQYVAQLIRNETGGELFEIQTVQEYPRTHEPLLEFAYEEKRESARPELASKIENLDEYNILFLGFPNWNADLPMTLYTFLKEHDLSGKTIIPFTVHGGSGFSKNIETIAELQPGATVVRDGLSISRDRVSDAESDVAAWVEDAAERLGNGETISA